MLDGVLSNNPSAAVEAVELQTGNSRQEADKKTRGVTNKCMMFLCILLAISIVANILFAILVKKDPGAQYFCPDNWIGFQDKCYYFSKEEGDWNSSTYNCLSQNADLVMIDTIEEKDFLKRYKCASDHWIWRDMTKDQTGQWVNGSIVNNWFNMTGNEICFYLNEDGVAKARCYTERKWICRKRMH
ncbi:C-type lectin domain family 2 member B isoform X2 [Balaenoptera musculus]|uniref:C-type lectin domain family 2 member B isoform X2 n=1 Tax=Balaenoptera musculus TaxID=9771 RepID=A0A8B8YSW6_BALMU|nr:C-type lectin domain family 2 member B isoform X2 [Balaenoptera musculus]